MLYSHSVCHTVVDVAHKNLHNNELESYRIEARHWINENDKNEMYNTRSM